MNHKGTRIIETERLILRPFVDEDAQFMFDNWSSDDEVTKYMNWPTHKDIYEAETVMQGWTKRYSDKNFYHWAIVDKNENQPAGSVSVISCDETVGKVEMGYCIGKKWWYKGIMAEALDAAINYLFNEVGVNRIQARHDTNNPNSGRVMQKCGMRYEGTMRKSDRTNNGICDIAYYAILAEEYKK